MNEKKFTPRAEEALRLAQEAAGELGHGYVGTEHLLLGLMREADGLAHTVLVEAGLTDELLVQILKRSVGVGLPGGNPAQGLTPRAKRVVEIAMEDAVRATTTMLARSQFTWNIKPLSAVIVRLPVFIPSTILEIVSFAS